ncbi:hypothetical protein FRC12_005128 [Ceratobasidium sp. 428]|nr:hypothetical protein FRC12_005128 [Ceratobasidium sp. 428]
MGIPGRTGGAPEPEAQPNVEVVPEHIHESYLVTLKESANVEKHMAWMKNLSSRYDGTNQKCIVGRQFEGE